jgi:MOB kinase activator 1
MMFGIGTAASRMTMKAAKRPEHKEDSSRPRRQALHHQHDTRRTFGMGFLRQAVVLPPGQEREEWLALHVVDFFKTLSVLVRIVQDDENRPRLDPGWGFPPGYEYLWVDPATRKPIKCSGPDYISHVLNWVEGLVNDERHFPAMPCSMGGSYSRDLEKTVKTVFKRLFRIFAILYTHHYQTVEEMGAVVHLNTAFRHFLFFSFEWDLLPPQVCLFS